VEFGKETASRHAKDSVRFGHPLLCHQEVVDPDLTGTIARDRWHTFTLAIGCCHTSNRQPVAVKSPNLKDEFSDRKVTLIQAWTLPRWLKGIPAADVSEINDENKGSRVR
jgi:hypothetical protein